jgi:hypothetical protein
MWRRPVRCASLFPSAGRGGKESTKLQEPSTKETSNIKKTSMSNARGVCRWSLVLDVSLVLGFWSLVLSPLLSELSICTFDIQDMTVNFPHA